MQRAHVALKPLQLLSVKDYAQKRKISINAAFRQVVDAGLTKLNIKKTPTQALVEWSSTTFNGPADLASNDDYLYNE